MSKEDELYHKYQSTQQKLKELSIMSEKIDRNYQSILDLLGLSPTELNEFMENSENFSPEIWEDMQKEKKKMEELLNLQMTALRDPKVINKKYSERGRIKQNWLFVR